MENKRIDKITENILINFAHNQDVQAIISKFGLRLFYSNGLRLGYPVKDYTKIPDAYVECNVHSVKPGKIDYICAETESFMVILYLSKIDSQNYTYSKLSYYDKLKRVGKDFENPNKPDNSFGTRLNKLLTFKRKK